MARRGWTAIEVRQEVFERYNTRVQRALGPTVYNSGGCSSYYLHSSGHNVANWPWSLARLHRDIRFNEKDYAVCNDEYAANRARRSEAPEVYA
jgi:cyclohexanone monooxygenase